MFLGIDHIGYAVIDLEKAIAHYKKIFNLEVTYRELLSSSGIEIAFLDGKNTKIELLQGKNQSNPITTFIAKRGEGLHHICYQVDDIATELVRLQKEGITLIDTTPRPGAHGTSIAFLHPKSFMGVLTELCMMPPE